jgi:predicted glycosyltransferase
METTHPKDVNILKNIVFELEKEGCEVLLAARDKEGVFEKLDDLGINYVPGTNYKGFLNKVAHIPSIEYWLYKIARKFKPDVIFGPSSLYAAHVSKYIGKPYLCFSDCEAEFDYTRHITVPFVTKIYVPNGFRLNLGERMERFDGYLELTYINSKYFRPDRSVLDGLGLDVDEPYIIFRISSLSGFHDVGVDHSPLKDIEDIKEFVKEVEKFAKVFVSGDCSVTDKFPENKFDINPNKFLDLLAFSSLYVGDGISVAAEAALLGVPSIYLSDENRRWGFIEDLARKNLVILTNSRSNAINRSTEILSDQNTTKEWKKRSKTLISEKADMVSFFVEKIGGRWNDR